MVATPALAHTPKLHMARTPEAAKMYAQQQVVAIGWNNQQWACLERLWTKESNWRPDAQNKIYVHQNGKKLRAGGIPQILGMDPKLNVVQQVNRGLKYIVARYTTPCSALTFHNRVNWY